MQSSSSSLLTWIAVASFILALVFLWIRVPIRTKAALVFLTVAILALLGRLWPWVTTHLGSYSNDWATAGVALVAFALALWQYRGSVEQTVRDFRWKQAEKAKEQGDALLTGNSMEALNLIDYPNRKYTVHPAGAAVWITTDEALEALALNPEAISSEKEFYIRDCFDDLLNKLDRIYSLIEIKYVLWADIAVVLRYYLSLLRDDQTALDVVLKYCDENGNWDAREIIGDKDRYRISTRRKNDVDRHHRKPNTRLEADVPSRTGSSE